jgi:hypothetical protein
MYKLKPDFEKSIERFKAFWFSEVIDRPPVDIRLPAVKSTAPPAPRKYNSFDSMWRDVDYRAECMAWEIENTMYLGDALPVAWPNMGPEVFSAWCGCKYHYTETTAWSEPCILDWANDAPKVKLNKEHELFILLERFTRNLLQLGSGKFLTALTDFHSGGDHVAALRDPQTFAMDLLDNPQQVKIMLEKSKKDYFEAFEHFYQMVKGSGGVDYTVAWMGSLGCEGRFYIPSNDFSCMVSTSMFEEFFLQGIQDECRFYNKSVYHLDGPAALRHLDALLSIPELGAIQWMPGAGNFGYSRWVDVYRRIQAAHKGMVLYIDASELPHVFETLRPEGVFFGGIGGISSDEEAYAVLKRIEKWE